MDLAGDQDELVELEHQPDDGEMLTRGEHRRTINLFVRRISRVERLCFEDKLDAAGAIERPSLDTIIRTIYRHVRVLRSWWGLGMRAVAVVGTLAGSFAAADAALKILGVL